MLYDRKIRYFNYIKNGERIRNGGFAKMEVRKDKCSLVLQISGLNLTDTFSRQVYLIARDREEPLCMIDLQAGKGGVQLSLLTDNLCSNERKGLSYEELEGIRIPIAAGVELYCKVAEDVKAERVSAEDVSVERVSAENMKMADVRGESMQKEGMRVLEAIDIPDAVKRMPEPVVPEQVVMPEQVVLSEENETGAEAQETAMQISAKQEPEQKALRMQEDKWQQLSTIYPHIQPFKDSRDYLKLNPEDFVIMNNRFYKLVHNSFLLHGYYNYQHLILARVEQKGTPCFYIGVPGNFYDREKQVALMFGFESFECRTEPANTGDYGYYMIRTEL